MKAEMKNLLLIFVSLFLFLLVSGCASLPADSGASENTVNILAAPDKAQFNHNLNTLQDGQSVSWRNEDDNTAYDLTAESTHLNQKGMVCRGYSLSVDKDYHRKQTINSNACRDNGSWVDNDTE